MYHDLMTHVLISWVGFKDRAGSEGDSNPGPVAHALEHQAFDAVVLLSDLADDYTARYQSWLGDRLPESVDLSILSRRPDGGPSNIAGVYHEAVEVVQWARERYGREATFTYHLSPGTQVMGAVWLLLASTEYPATLIESSDAVSLNVVDVPFHLRAINVEKFVRDQQEVYDWLTHAGIDRSHYPAFHHAGPQMRNPVNEALHFARLPIPILLCGESGTGKDIFANMIHLESERSGAFQAVNCSAIAPELMESTLFGHVRGAFTGAVERHEGLFVSADKGTLFLDELGEMQLELQAKLLRVLQDGRITPVGTVESIQVDVRLICATHRDLEELVDAGEFREDLMYRIDGERITLPPLRDRSDFGYVVDHALKDVCAEMSENPGVSGDEARQPSKKVLTAAARQRLRAHDWPGNYRELEATLRRAVARSMGETIDEHAVARSLRTRTSPEDRSVLSRRLDESFSIRDLIAEVKRHYARRALTESGGSKTRASDLLGVTRPTLDGWLAER